MVMDVVVVDVGVWGLPFSLFSCWGVVRVAGCVVEFEAHRYVVAGGAAGVFVAGAPREAAGLFPPDFGSVVAANAASAGAPIDVALAGAVHGGAFAPAVHAALVDAAAPPADAHILPEYGASLPPPAAAHAEFFLFPVGSKNSIVCLASNHC
jgi:hypothetical protein